MRVPEPDGGATKIIEEMVRRIVDHAHPERVILFGSYATGQEGPDSDVDLLVVVRDAADRRARAVALYGLLAGMGLPKDIIVVTPEEVERFRHVPGTIVSSAVREGKLLYERPT